MGADRVAQICDPMPLAFVAIRQLRRKRPLCRTHPQKTRKPRRGDISVAANGAGDEFPARPMSLLTELGMVLLGMLYKDVAPNGAEAPSRHVGVRACDRRRGPTCPLSHFLGLLFELERLMEQRFDFLVIRAHRTNSVLDLQWRCGAPNWLIPVKLSFTTAVKSSASVRRTARRGRRSSGAWRWPGRCPGRPRRPRWSSRRSNGA